MTITFRIDDGHAGMDPTPAIVTPEQLASLRDLLADRSERMQVQLAFVDHDDPDDGSFAFEARVCPLSLASVAACFDHDPAVIAVLDEAQFRGRRIRLSRDAARGDAIRLALSWSHDAAPELNVANGNAYALLETLGLDAESVGEIPVDELRDRLTDPRIRRRLDGDPWLARYVPRLVAMAAVKPVAGVPHLAWG